MQCNGGHLPDVICRKLACNVWVVNSILGHIYRRFRLFFPVSIYYLRSFKMCQSARRHPVYIYIYMELLVKPEILTSYVYIDLRLATQKAVFFYLLLNASTLNQCRKLSCVTTVCKHFASYPDYPNYKWDLIR
jgi:hypothetical protein